MERLESGVEAVKEFLFTLTSDQRWGVMLAFEELEPQVFSGVEREIRINLIMINTFANLRGLVDILTRLSLGFGKNNKS
ncbi:hypothetical protein [Nostoc sphaeroides]|uniref:Uncharacterized protein n=1 Tax=Nostoc sphaeroides CCNUC1 TaxID=2653204 RepID=A0A5P8WEX7_9NOSO|nr:hypothetical protein [Nostoc sphaeroides]QFS51373.1 hypothetical protein GXM_08867 [Nostoc sphaeroides CCNUC1]